MHSARTTVRAAFAFLVPVCALLSYGGTTVQLDLALLLVLVLGVLALGPTRRKAPSGIYVVAWALFLLPILQLLVPCSLSRHAALCEPPLGIVSTFPGWITHSLDPGNTLVYVVQGCAILLSIHFGLLVVAKGLRKKLALGCAAAASIVVLVSLFHELAGLEKLFGFYTPTHQKRVLGPVLNANHFGAVGAAGVWLSVGLATDRRQGGYRPGWLALALLCGLAVGWSASRAAAGGLVLGGLVFTVLYLRRLNKDAASTRQLGAFVFGGVLISAVAGFLSPLGKAFAEKDLSKFELFAQSSGAVLENPLLGAGRGAFAVVHTSLWDGERAYFPENLLIQWSSDWGLPITVALIVAIGTVILGAIRRSSTSPRAGAISAFISLVAHDMFDFALEMTGIAVFASLTLCIAAGSWRARSSSRTNRRMHVAVVAAATAVLALAFSGRIPERAETFVVKAATSHDSESLDWKRAAADHPNDPAVLLTASRLADKDETNKIAAHLVNRAMVRAPNWPGPHLQAARLLSKAGRVSQAMLELRKAEGLKAGSTYHVLCSLARSDELPAQLLWQAVPEEGASRIDALGGLWKCLPAKSPLEKEVYAELARVPPSELPAHSLQELGHRELEAGEYKRARALLERATNKVPTSEGAWILLARTYAEEGNVDKALALLERAKAHTDRPEKVMLELTRIHAAKGDMSAARAALKGVRTRATSRRSDRAAAMRLLAQLEASAGNLHLAIDAYRSAYRFGHDQALREASEAATRAGHSLIAQRLRREHCAKNPGEQWCTDPAQ